ncbi:hypothetical protein GGQ73_000100 [Rhizobium skierniewicense]|uniref:Uncharacterized protein n=1 Tax=Rhizobium skierniewicense TaxID=984260 RepID=A0A7W6C6R0_9HYPH|nr:hypothetical protein [Rhizobium skierniewicense]MBB3944177.1 hypothetical protein [Rhizobium skierniewicense]
MLLFFLFAGRGWQGRGYHIARDSTVEREDIGTSERDYSAVTMERLIAPVGEGRDGCEILAEIVWHSDHPSPEKFPLKSEVAHHATR